MAVPKRWVLLLPALLALAAGGLLYTGVVAFRVRELTEVCNSGKCTISSATPTTTTTTTTTTTATTPAASWTGRAKRGFAPVSVRGGFVKVQPSDEQADQEQEGEDVEEEVKNKEKGIGVKGGKKNGVRWSKLVKRTDVTEEEDEEDNVSGDVEEDNSKIDSDDEIIQIEVEEDDDNTVVEESEEEEDREEMERLKKEDEKRMKEEQENRRKEKETFERRKREEEEKKRRERELELERKRKEEEERRRKEKELEERRRREKELEERRKRQEEERRKKEEEEQRRKVEEAERRRKVEEEERRRKEEEERRRKEEEEERRRKEEEEQRRKEEEERRRKEEEKRLKREKEERHKKEEEKRLREEEERRQKEEAERRQKEEEERRQKEKEERLKKEEEERLKKEEDERLKKEEEERLKKEEDERLKKEEEKKKNAERKIKEEEERKKRELEEKEAARKKKVEEERIRKKQEDEEEAERKKDEEEDRKRLERVKREAEEKKIRDEEERRKRAKPKKPADDDDDEDEDDADEEDEDQDLLLKQRLEKLRLADKDKAKSEEASHSKPGPTKSSTKSNNNGSTKSKSTKSAETKKAATADESKAKPVKRRGPDSATLNLAELNEALLSVPSFVPNFTAAEDLACQQHGKIFLRQLRGYKLWALQMLDSSAKIPAGLLRGNVNQLGDFDQCLGVTARVKIDEKTLKVQGKYCLASVDIYAVHPATKLPVNLLQSRAMVRGNMRDPGHFVPRFTTINWALCLPAACSADDARRTIEDALNGYNMTVGIKFVVDVDPDMCYVKQKTQSYSKETIGVLYFYAMFVCLAIVATLRDYLTTLQAKGNYSERIIMAFSLKRTVRALFGSERTTSPSDISCIHGIRSLSTIALYVAHKLIPTARMPYANRIALTEAANNPLSTVLRASLFYTDSFLLLSGVLTAFNMAKELSRRGEIRWFCRFIGRFVRLTPSLLAVVFWYAFVMEHTGSGPQWNSAVKANADICKESSWINLLYVQNFFPFEEMCATHTHQLALDMQLSLAAPALVFFLQIKPIVGIIVVFFLLQVSATLRYLATSNNNLSLVIFHGMSMKHLYKTANMTYALPLHRATPYLIGVSLGVLLHHTGKNVRIHKILNIIGWFTALALGSWSLFSPWRLAKRDYVYDVEEATHYAVISPILSSLALSWAIFACFTNNGGIINRLLSSYWMVVFSRMSYAIYLSQFAVFFYNVGTARYSSEFQTFRLIDPYEAVSVAMVSVVLTLLFDIPMQEVKIIIMECGDSQATVETNKSKEALAAEENHSNNVNKIPQNISREEENEEVEPAPGGWNWNRGTFVPPTPEYDENGLDESYRSSRLKRQDVRRQTMIRSEAYDEWSNGGVRRRSEDPSDEGRTSRSEYRTSNAGLENEDEGYLHPRERYFSGAFSRSPMRDLDAPVFRRSVSRERIPVLKAPEIPPRKPIITISKEEDYQTTQSPRSSVPRFTDQQRSLSSESETDAVGNPRSTYSRRSAEPRIADEEEWEDEIRLRRSRYHQELAGSQERDRVRPPVLEEEGDEEWDLLKRRSSAEGKMALLKEPPRPGNMDLWTVSKMQLGSSQEPDEDELDGDIYHRRDYREQGPPLREEFEGEEEDQGKSYASESLPTSFEEEEDPNYEFTLKKDSKRITVQDLSKISVDDDTSVDNSWNKLDVKTTSSGLFKRESIVKSQASEEDPEYLLPERPKLVEQEQEHPFKKAWQMQKSRSEEEGSSAFIVKDSKPPPPTLGKQREESEDKTDEDDREGAQCEELIVPDVTCDVTIVWQARSHDTEETKSTSKSESSSSTRSSRQWPDDDDQDDIARIRNRRKSEEENWMWTERDT